MSTHAATANDAPLEASWSDPKRYLWLLGLIVPTGSLHRLWARRAHRPRDHVVGRPVRRLRPHPLPRPGDRQGLRRTRPTSAIKWLEQDSYYRWCTYLFLPLQFAGAGLRLRAVGRAATSPSSRASASRSPSRWSAGSRSTPRTSSATSARATRSGWRRSRSRRPATATSSSSTTAATTSASRRPEDPASSRLGESFWEFLPRTVCGQPDAPPSTSRRCASTGSSKPFFTIHNDVLNAWAMTVVLFGALTAIFGIEVLPWLLVQAVVGFSLLEVVNYLEHYGLLRQKQEDGRYERCAPEHSWNSDNVASNVFLYHLQRHSDHHANPTRRYQALRHFEEAAGAALGLRDDDRARLRDAALAPGDGPAGARPLRRRRDPRQHPAAQAGEDPRQVRRRGRDGARVGRWRATSARSAGTSTTRPRAPRARASRPGRRGARSPTTGPAPTAASARRSTSVALEG